MQKSWLITAVLGAVVLAGCGSATETAVPSPSLTQNANTLDSLNSSESTVTDFSRATLPPEWTQSATDGFGTLSETPLPQPTWDATGTWLFQQPTATVCANFHADMTQNLGSFLPGNDLPITWQSVEGATGYKVTVMDQSQRTVFEDFAGAATMYIIPGAVLNVEPFYVWTVRPYDGAGRQLCNAIGLLVNYSI